MKNTLRTILVAAALIVSGCGSSNGGSPDNVTTSSEAFSYSFEYNGCKTEHHEFHSVGELCSGLQNEGLNNGCAGGMRAQMFADRCPGQTYTGSTDGSDLTFKPIVTSIPNADEMATTPITDDSL
jgi:hypothetical protein